ncbi:hypothetical protein RGQ29_008482 [Quercus rubra]|uniref:Reverse transcriptase n=1 Tax=Quercus rubra TaxID=3512 RepID=A0AAN7I8R8_QUERU|nr:hypothetical protein RGQ29_008482 [Quercus rubra]
MGLINRAVIRSLWGGQHVDWSYLGSCGASGGVLVMWDTRVVNKMEETVERFSVSCLIDLPLQGGTFTWSNSREVASKARLDRFLFFPDWEDKFPTIFQRRMSRLCSDHFPIVLKGGSFQRGSMLFRFENMWLKDEGFVDRVRSWWDSYQVHGAPSFILANKLKLLKNDLKRWNVEVFGLVEVRIKKLWKDPSVLENMEES